MNLSAIIVTLLVVSIIIFNSLNNEISKDKFSKRVVIFVSILLVLAAAFRSWSVGADTWTFVDDFNSVPNMSFVNVWEQYMDYPSTYIIMWIVGKLGLPIFCFFGLVELIYLTCIYCFIDRLSKNRLYAFFCFFTIGLFFPSMNILKQILAVGFVLISFCRFSEEKYKKALLYFVLAFSFHQSTIIFLIGYIFYYFRNNRKLTKVFLLLSIIMAFVGNVLWTTMLSGFGNEHYQMYLESDDSYTSTTLYYFGTIGLIAYLFRKDYYRTEPHLTNVYCLFVLLACIIQSFSTSYSIAHRLAYYYVPFFAILLPNCVYYMKNRSLAVAVQWTTIAMMSFFCIYTQSKVPFSLLFTF